MIDCLVPSRAGRQLECLFIAEEETECLALVQMDYGINSKCLRSIRTPTSHIYVW